MADQSDFERDKVQRLQRAMYSRSLSPNLKERPRRDLHDDGSSVSSDWAREEGHLPQTTVAPPGMHAARIVLRLVVASSVLFFLGAGGFFVYYFSFGGGAMPVSPGNIDITVTGPLQITSGEPAQFQISVINRNRMPLELAELVVKYPKGTRSPTDLLNDLPSQRIPLGTIETGGRRQGTVSAVFAGIEGEHGRISVELEYRIRGSNSVFVASSQYQFLFASSPLIISVEGNRETVSGQPIEMKVSITSNADTVLKDVLFMVDVPFGFTLSSTEPKLPAGKRVWALGDLPPGEKRVVTLQGTLVGESGDERMFRFSAGTRKDMGEEEIQTKLADYAHALLVSRPFLDLSVLVNRESTSGTSIVSPGDVVSISVAWQNNLATAITDAVIVARLSGLDIDGTTVRTPDGFYRSSDSVVLWDKATTNGALASIAPGTRGNLTFSFQAPKGEALADIQNPRLLITVHAAGKRVSEAGVPETLQATARQTLRVASAIEVIAQGLYYSNPFGSQGPMPPKAGVETTYAIVFSVTNTTNTVEDAFMKATLPPYIRWVGIYSPSHEKVTFNPNDSTLTWDVGVVEPGVGIGSSVPRQAAIAIGFTPSTSQIGQQPPLVRDVTLTGKDTSTQASIVKTSADVTTNIVGDPGFSATDATVVK